MKKSLLKSLIAVFAISLSVVTYAETFRITTGTPGTDEIRAPKTLVYGQTAVAVYTVTNTYGANLDNNSVVNLPAGVSQAIVPNDARYCGAVFSLRNKESCLLKLSIETEKMTRAIDGVYPNASPEVCFFYEGTPIRCTQASADHRLMIDMPVDDAKDDMPVLQVTTESPTFPDRALLIPNVNTATITVTNPAHSSQAANNVIPAIISSSFNNQIEIPEVAESCKDLQPGESCEIVFTPKANAEDEDLQPIIISGSNTYAAQVNMAIANQGIQFEPIVFNEPGTENIVVKNVTDFDMQISNVSISGSDIKNVIANKGNCSFLAANSSCEISASAVAASYGQGRINIDYQYLHEDVDEITFTASNDVSVIETTIVINNNLPIKISPVMSNSLNVIVKNTGAFNWIKPNINLERIIENLALNTSDCTDKISVPAETGSCTLVFTPQNPAPEIGETTIIKAVSVNGRSLSKTVTIDGGVAVTRVADESKQHLQYQTIAIANLSPETVTLDEVEIPNHLSGKVTWCARNESNCENFNTGEQYCARNDQTLAKGQICYIVLKAQQDPQQTIGVNSGTVSIKASSNSDNYLHEFSVTQDLSLYAVGTFNLSNENRRSNIARWDGNQWTNLAKTSINGAAHAVVVYKGDLVVGGRFSAIDAKEIRKIARWTGKDWFVLNNNVGLDKSDDVKNLSVINAKLYVSGEVNSVSSKDVVRAANGLAIWDGEQWEIPPIQTDSRIVNDSVYHNNELCVAETITAINNSVTNSVSCLNLPSNTWNPVNPAELPNATIQGLVFHNNILYIGGPFNYIQDKRINHLSQLLEGLWKPVNDSTNKKNGTAGQVFTLKSHKNRLYAGGGFSGAGSTPANNVAYYENNRWYALGNGVTTQNSDNSRERVQSIIFNPNNDNQVFVAGIFDTAGTIPANNIAYWDGNTWYALGEGLLPPNEGQVLVTNMTIAPGLTVSIQ